MSETFDFEYLSSWVFYLNIFLFSFFGVFIVLITSMGGDDD